jgi:two-component system, sensor histidine kinase PdtaS
MMKPRMFLLFIACSLLLKVSGQSPVLDSLQALLQKHVPEDTIRVGLLNKLAVVSFESDKEKALAYVDEAIYLSDSLGFLKGKGSALFIKGNYYLKKADFAKAIDNYKASAEITKQSGESKELINTFKNIGYCYSMLGNTTEGIVYFKKVLKLNQGNEPGTAYSLINLGNVYEMIGDVELAVECYYKAINIWSNLDDQFEVADLYNNLGYLYMNVDRSYKAMDAYLKALVIYEGLGNVSRIALVQNGLGAVYHGLNELSKAKEYFLLSLKTNTELNDQEGIAYCLSNLASIANEESDSELALSYYKEAFIILSELGLKGNMASVLNNQNKAYKALGDYKNSIESSKKALEIFKEVNNKDGQISAYVGLTLTYFEMGDYIKTEYYALKGLEQSEDFGAPHILREAHEKLFLIYESKGDFKKALYHHKKFMAINDSLFNSEKIRKISGLESKYAFDKEKQILVLGQEKTNALHLAEIKRQRFRSNALIVGVVLLLLLFALILRGYLIKRNANRILTDKNAIISKQKEEKELLVKEIHHRVKNNLQVISSLFDLQLRSTDNPETKSTLIDGLNRVKSVGLIHQLLYQSEDVIHIDFGDFVGKLLDHITSFATKKEIKQSVIIPDGLQFDIATTLPLGLIITELMTNAFKYAFDNVDTCSISIKLDATDDDQFRLVLQDNGSGFPDGFDFKTPKTLGLRLVRALSIQIAGEINYRYDNGARFLLTFPKGN